MGDYSPKNALGSKERRNLWEFPLRHAHSGKEEAHEQEGGPQQLAEDSSEGEGGNTSSFEFRWDDMHTSFLPTRHNSRQKQRQKKRSRSRTAPNRSTAPRADHHSLSLRHEETAAQTLLLPLTSVETYLIPTATTRSRATSPSLPLTTPAQHQEGPSFPLPGDGTWEDAYSAQPMFQESRYLNAMLPNELLANIFFHVGLGPTLVNALLVCRRWRDCGEDSHLWHALHNYFLGGTKDPLYTWKQAVKNDLSEYFHLLSSHSSEVRGREAQWLWAAEKGHLALLLRPFKRTRECPTPSYPLSYLTHKQQLYCPSCNHRKACWWEGQHNRGSPYSVAAIGEASSVSSLVDFGRRATQSHQQLAPPLCGRRSSQQGCGHDAHRRRYRSRSNNGVDDGHHLQHSYDHHRERCGNKGQGKLHYSEGFIYGDHGYTSKLKGKDEDDEENPDSASRHVHTLLYDRFGNHRSFDGGCKEDEEEAEEDNENGIFWRSPLWKAKALYLACMHGHSVVVSAMIARGVDVNWLSSDGRSALLVASTAGNTTVVNELLEAQAQVNFASARSGSTSLHLAAQYGHIDVVKLLLDQGAAVNAKTRKGTTPLYIAAMKGHDKVVELLLRHGAATEVCNKKGRTPLFTACAHAHTAVARKLIEAGANVNYICADNGTTPLYWAAHLGEVEMVKLLLSSGANVHTTRSNKGRTPLFWAAAKGHTEVVRILLEHGSQVNVVCEERETTPLYWASSNGHVATVQTLLSYGAEVDIFSSDDGTTALYWAASNGHNDVVKALIAAGADPNAACKKDGSTPLFIAAQNGHKHVVKTLIQCKADINSVCSDDGSTPLYFASLKGHVGIVDLLLRSGADVNCTTLAGYTPLHQAASKNTTQVMQLLLNAGADVDAVEARGGLTPLYLACSDGHLEAVELLIERGANVNFTCSKDGSTPLFIASQNGRASIVKKLLSMGVAINICCTDDGSTPLYFACLRGNNTCVQLLLAAGADVNIRTHKGSTALIAACKHSGRLFHYRSPSRGWLVSTLLNAGADVNATYRSKNHVNLHISPLFWAITNKDIAVMALLLAAGADPTDVKDLEGRTAWDLARDHKREDLLKLLKKQRKKAKKLYSKRRSKFKISGLLTKA